MSRHTNVVRTTLALALAALMGAGCFWLEPIAPHHPDASDGNPQDPDGGSNPDGGDDPDSGVPPLGCGPETPVPAGATVALLHGERAWMYLAPGDTLLPGGGGLRLQLDETYAQEVPVKIVSSAAGIVEPEHEWVCIPAGETEVTVGLQALAVGETHLELLVDAEVTATLRVNVVEGKPTFTIDPRHGYYNPQDTVTVTLDLSHPSLEPVTIIVSEVDGDRTELHREVVPGEVLQHSFDLTFWDTPDLRVRVHSPELGHEETTDFRRAVRHLLISEVLLDPNNGFIELYNPTGEMLSLQSQELVVQLGHENFSLVAGFDNDHAVQARSYFLVGWGSYGANATLPGSPGGLNNAFRLFLGKRHGSGKSMSSVIDALRYERGWVHGEMSLERKAWPDAAPDDMESGGRYAFVGNADDNDSGSIPREESLDDFVLREEPQAQNTFADPESFFTP